MTFQWPGFLLLLGLIPPLIGGYIWMLRRRRRYAVRYTSLSLLREVAAPTRQWRRHMPFALFLAALALLVLGLARPMAVISVPTNQTSIILTIDVSRSMCSTDIPPNRLAAAEEAALQFIQRQHPNTRIGIVAFAGFAELIQAPTTDRAALEAAVDSLTTSRRTAIGSGILAALEVITQGNPSIAPLDQPAPPRPPDSYAPEIIVLLTDGVSMTGPEPLDVATLAAERGVRIYTIGFGTANGAPLVCDGQYLGDSRQFGGGSGGFNFRRGIDEEALIQVADLTGGSYYPASSADELQRVFGGLPLTFTSVDEFSEVSAICAGLGAAMAALAIGLSLRWNPLP